MKKKIIIIEDEQSLCVVWKRWLTRSGFEVLLVQDSGKAIPLIENEKPDLLLIDVLMPKIDGIALSRRIRQDDSLVHIPIILMSAIYKDRAFILHAKQISDDFIEKPFTEEELIKRVKKYLPFEEKTSSEEEIKPQEIVTPTHGKKSKGKLDIDIQKALDDLLKRKKS